MKRLTWTIVAVLAVALAGTLVSGSKPDQIRAAHPVHAGQGLTCDGCHPARGSHAGSDNLLPAMDKCAECHDVTEAAGCGTCHTNPAEPAVAARVTSVAQKFPHAAHLGAGTDCAACHGPTEAAEPRLPEKAVCRTCHETASGNTDCRVCHAESEELLPGSHTKGWISQHGVEARVDQARCADCHTQKSCDDCHAGDNVRPPTHPLDYDLNHALDARSGELTCSGCHEDPQYCQECHRARHVMPQNHSRADWLLARGGGRHAEEGEFDLESCASCHDAGTSAPICAECHGR